MINTDVLAKLLKEKKDIEANLAFLGPFGHLNVLIYNPNTNESLNLLDEEEQTVFKQVITKRQQRLADINAIFKEIDITLKELSDKCPELLSTVSNAGKSNLQ
jgi:restriction endonuclease S subunit